MGDVKDTAFSVEFTRGHAGRENDTLACVPPPPTNKTHLDHLVLPRREKVRMAVAERQPPHRADVTGQRDLERVGTRHARARQVEDLYDPVGAPGGEEGVGRVEGHGPDPPEVRGEDRGELPGGVPLGRGDVGRRALPLLKELFVIDIDVE